MRNTLVRARIAVLAVCALYLAWQPEAHAQSCRRSCKPGEKRDPRGCCIAESKPKEMEKPAKPATPASSSSKKPTKTRPSGQGSRSPEGSDDAGKSEAPGADLSVSSVKEREVPPALEESNAEAPQELQSVLPVTTEPQQDSPVQQPEPPNENGSVAPGATRNAVTTRRWPTWKPWAVMGAGTAVAAAGGLFQWRASENITEYERNIADCGGCALTDEQRDLVSHARSQWLLARSAYIFGGAAIATGIMLVMLNRPSVENDKEPSSISFIPKLSPEGTSISMVLRY